LQFSFRENVADEPMKPRSGCEQNRDDNPDAAGQRWALHRKPAEQDGCRQRDFGREAGILFMPAPISDGGQDDGARGRNRDQHLTADKEADGTGKRSDGEGSYSGGRA
jgi:hypothetical protein